LFSQPVLVALDSGRGVVYASASGWDKVCLLWTFRNFRSLPQNVLSPRQQQLIASLYLYREASAYQPTRLHPAIIVGTVEGFRPPSLPTVATSAKVRNPGAEKPHKKPASVTGGEPFCARFAFTSMPLKVATALLVIAIAVLVWHQLGAQPVAELRAAQTVAAMHPHDLQIPIENSPVPGNLETATTHVGTAAPAVQPSTAPPAGSATPSTTAPLKSAHPGGVDGGPAPPPVLIRPTGKDGRGRQPSITAPAPVFEAAADRPRMQISGRPRKLVYPVCPETRARGKVSLQAVVGYDGAVNRVRVLTGDRTLAAAAIEAVRQWRYEPFSSAVSPLERETNITISFISNEVVAVSFSTSTPLSR
jgi:TonB family protein